MVAVRGDPRGVRADADVARDVRGSHRPGAGDSGGDYDSDRLAFLGLGFVHDYSVLGCVAAQGPRVQVGDGEQGGRGQVGDGEAGGRGQVGEGESGFIGVCPGALGV